jgi:hypothetical protein
MNIPGCNDPSHRHAPRPYPRCITAFSPVRCGRLTFDVDIQLGTWNSRCETCSDISSLRGGDLAATLVRVTGAGLAPSEIVNDQQRRNGPLGRYDHDPSTWPKGQRA